MNKKVIKNMNKKMNKINPVSTTAVGISYAALSNVTTAVNQAINNGFVFEKIPKRYAVRSTVYQRKYRKGIP